MKRFFAFIICLSASFLLFSCTSNEIGNSKDVSPQSIYFDYQVRGEETEDYITVMLQYRFAGPNGTTLLLEKPSQVEFDGRPIKADSSKMTGAFYEVIIPAKEFTGTHSIVFTGLDKKRYTESFSFRPMVLKTKVPETIKNDSLVLDLDGMDSLDYVRISLTDTSFSSPGINRVDTVRNGHLILSSEDFKSVVNGPVNLELFREAEKPVKEGTEEGGLLYISYSIRRQFALQIGTVHE